MNEPRRAEPDHSTSTRPRACLVRQVDRVETPLVRDATALAERGFDVDLVIMRIRDDAGRPDLPDHVDVVELPIRRRRGGLASYIVDYLGFLLMATVVIAIRHLRRRYDLVQTISLPDPLVITGLFPAATGAALILKLNEPTPQLSAAVGQPPWLQRVLGRLQIWSARRADHVITVTDELAVELASRGVPADRISVVLNVPPGAMAEHATGARPDIGSFTVISHGSVLERYGHETIVRAVAKLRAEHPQTRLVLTGQGEHLDRVLQLVDELDLGDAVEHHAWLPLDELVGLLERSDAGIVAQRANAYSHLVNTNKMFEFFMLGVPAVCTRLDATMRLVPESHGAVEYFDADDDDELAAVLAGLAADPGRRSRMIRRGHEVWDRLGGDAQRTAYLDGVDQALQRAASGGRISGRRR